MTAAEALEIPTVWNAVRDFHIDFDALDLPTRMLTASEIPAPEAVSVPMRGLLDLDAGLAQTVSRLFAAAADAHPGSYLASSTPPTSLKVDRRGAVDSFAAWAEGIAAASDAFDNASSPEAAQAMDDADRHVGVLLAEVDALVDGLYSANTSASVPGLRPTVRATQALTTDFEAAAQATVDSGALGIATSRAQWLHSFLHIGRAPATAPSWSRQSSHLTQLGAEARGALAQLVRLSGRLASAPALPSAAPCASFDAAGAAVAEAALVAHGGHYASLCCPVRAALADIAGSVGPAPLGLMRGMLAAAARRDWAAAAAALRASNFCAASAATCEPLAASLAAGCAEVAFFASPPTWHDFTSATCAVADAEAPAVVCLDVSVVVRAELRCGGQPVTVALPLTQSGVRMRFHAATSISADAALRAASAVRLDASGALTIRRNVSTHASNADRAELWWSEHSQLAMNAHLLEELLVGGADPLCDAADLAVVPDLDAADSNAGQNAMQAIAAAALARHGGRLVLSPIDADGAPPADAVGSALLAARRLSSNPRAPVLVGPAEVTNGDGGLAGECAMACPRGARSVADGTSNAEAGRCPRLASEGWFLYPPPPPSPSQPPSPPSTPPPSPP